MEDTCWFKNKRMRLDDGCNNNIDNEVKENEHWSCAGDTSLVEPEILEDMGVSMLADGEGSRESLLKTQECTISPKNFKGVTKHRLSSHGLYHKEDMSTFKSVDSGRTDGFEDTQEEIKDIHVADDAINYSATNNESGYMSRVDSENFPEAKENFSKEHASDIPDAQALDPFHLFRRKKRTSVVGEDKFRKLSDEMILMILKWLPKKCLVRSMLVCKRWCQIARDEALWVRLDLGSKVLNEGTIGYVLPRGVQILRLAQAELIHPIFTQTNEISENFICKLQYLDLSMAVITIDDLSQLLSKCKYLKKLSLEKCTLDYSCCVAIGQNEELEILNLTMCDGIDFSSIKEIMKLKKLTSLNLAWCSLDIESITELCKSLPSTVTRLNVAGCRKTLNDDNLNNLVQCCPGLNELDLSDCTMLTDYAIQILLKLNDLEHLSLSRCYSIHCMMMIRLQQMVRLRYLDLFGTMPEEVFKSFQAKCNKFELNKCIFSAIARPTVGVKRTSIWNLRVRD